MGFEVRVTQEAYGDLDAIAEFLKGQASIDVARRWFAGIIGAIDSLSEMPARCPLAPEAKELEAELRILLHGRRNRAYKIYFKIKQDDQLNGSVLVFHIRHWARKPLTNQELEELTDDLEDSSAIEDQYPPRDPIQ
jgi:plasmid stabilization system protein ParE